MNQYPGYIERQQLIDFCREQLPRIQHHVETLEKARDLTSDPVKIQNFDEAIARLFGEQTSLRNVCEWSATVTVAEIPGSQADLKNQYDGVSH